jgi:hypothetical protein
MFSGQQNWFAPLQDGLVYNFSPRIEIASTVLDLSPRPLYRKPDSNFEPGGNRPSADFSRRFKHA